MSSYLVREFLKIHPHKINIDFLKVQCGEQRKFCFENGCEDNVEMSSHGLQGVALEKILDNNLYNYGNV